jgi:hypothetical protein
MIDQGLLLDLGPYSHAYGHVMSNFIYGYQRFAAYHEVLGEKYGKAAEYYERVLRSFLVTKNITYSKSLVKNDMKLDEALLEHPILTSEQREDVESVVRQASNFLEGIRKEICSKKAFVSDIQIRAENLRFAYPDSPICDAIDYVVAKAGRSQRADGVAGGLKLTLILYQTTENYIDAFKVRFYRVGEDKDFIGYSWFMEVSEAVITFPEILKMSWKVNK